MAKIKSDANHSKGHKPRWILAAVQMPERRPRATNKPPECATIDGHRFPLSDVFRVFFPFVAERHMMFKKRLAKQPRPWTEDAILNEFPFTNVFRVLDRNTQYILRNVIRQGEQDLTEMFFRVLLFRTFNKIETWELLQDNLGPLTWKTFSLSRYEQVLDEAPGALYGPAYIIPSPKLGYKRNYQNHLRMIETMMGVDHLPTELAKLKHLKDVHGRIQMYQSMGDFMAMQSVSRHFVLLTSTLIFIDSSLT
jgi:hypothetical protein